MEGKMNLQDTFLNEARKENVPVSIFLMNGVQLKGKVKSFDSFTVLLVSENRSQLIYKHAISTIVPLHPVALYDPCPASQAQT